MSDTTGLSHREKLYLILLGIVVIFTGIFLLMRKDATAQIAAQAAANADNNADPDYEDALLQAALESSGTSDVTGASVTAPTDSAAVSTTSSIGTGDPNVDNLLSALTTSYLNYNSPTLSASTIAPIADNSSSFISALQSNDPITGNQSSSTPLQSLDGSTSLSQPVATTSNSSGVSSVLTAKAGTPVFGGGFTANASTL